ncbi:MAG: ATP-binding protein [Candidatus Hodarchaeaceae archaeon]|nr:ATP-binding protein [Candidatus Hodarchaeaceae archaeon]
MAVELGSVICTGDGPSSSEFSFVVTADGRIPARRGQFVELETEEGRVVAFITRIIKTNRYFMRPESVKEYERGGRSLASIFPADRWEYLIADARTLGVLAENGLERASFPPSPGQKVYEAEPPTLARFLGLNSSNGIEIGELKHHNVPVRLDLTKLLRKHVAVLAVSGAGKSFTSSVIIEELLDRPPGAGRVAVVVIDVHGEYTGFAEPGEGVNYSGRTAVIRAKDMRVGVPNLSSLQFKEFVPDMSEVQARELQRVLDELRAEMRSGRGPFGLNEVIARVEQNGDLHRQMQQALLGWLFDLRSLGIFDRADYPSWEGIVEPGKVVIVDLSDMTSLRKKQMLVAYAARKLFNARKRGRVPPFVLCLEEAHNFVPSEAAISKHIIETIAREGRKFYASLVLISQRPVRLSTTVLSQANTNIILRVTNPYDLEHIKQSSEAITSEVADMVSSLPVGEALVVGEAVNHPIFVKVRCRRSHESTHGTSLEEAAKEFERRSNQAREDAKAFS